MTARPRDENTLGGVARLEELKMVLAERDYTTASDLAADLGVSLRTLHRDLATLRDLGIAVGGLSGRGGGVVLERGWSLGRVHLNESEAMGVLLCLAIAQQVNSPLLLGDIRSIERKVTQAFAPSQASRIRSLRRRVIIGQPASTAVLATYRPPTAAITRPLLETFTSLRVFEIRYSDQTGTLSRRSIEVHYIYYSLPVWYALAWDRLRKTTSARSASTGSPTRRSRRSRSKCDRPIGSSTRSKPAHTTCELAEHDGCEDHGREQFSVQQNRRRRRVRFEPATSNASRRSRPAVGPSNQRDNRGPEGSDPRCIAGEVGRRRGD